MTALDFTGNIVSLLGYGHAAALQGGTGAGAHPFEQASVMPGRIEPSEKITAGWLCSRTTATLPVTPR